MKPLVFLCAGEEEKKKKRKLLFLVFISHSVEISEMSLYVTHKSMNTAQSGVTFNCTPAVELQYWTLVKQKTPGPPPTHTHTPSILKPIPVAQIL